MRNQNQHEIASAIADALETGWRTKARPDQLAPPGDWSFWLLCCQSAVNFNPGSASNIDPGGGSSMGSTGTRASWSDRRESDEAMRGGYLWAPVGEPVGVRRGF